MNIRHSAAALILAAAMIGSAAAVESLNAAPPLERRQGFNAAFVERSGSIEFSGQLIVRPLQGLPEADDHRARRMLDGMVAEFHPEVDEYVIDVPGAVPARFMQSEAQRAATEAIRGRAENALAAKLVATGLFEYAVPNWICHALTTTPNDPLFASQWHHPVMQTPQAWDLVKGSNSVICAFTDTGIDLTHEDLASQRVLGYDAYGNVAESAGGSVADLGGHGTHVAGCSSAIGENGRGVSGVCQATKIMMVRVAIYDNPGSAYLDDINEGARWAIDHGAKVVSASYGGVDYSPIQTTGAYIKSKNALYCYAAGNDARDLNFFDWADVIVVGASSYGDGYSGFSAYGLAVDVFAPGVDILSTCLGGGYCYASGTSMATPVCNGVIGLIWSMNPNLTAAQVQDILFTSCDDLGDPGNDNFWGWGRVNPYKAALAAKAMLPVEAAPVVNDDLQYSAVGGLAKRLDVLRNDYDPKGDSVVITTFPSSTTAGGTLTRSVGTGPGGRDELLYTAPLGFTGTDQFTYTGREPSGIGDTAVVKIAVNDPATFRSPDAAPDALPSADVAYYALSNPQVVPDFTTLTPYATDVVSTINFPSSSSAFATSGRATEIGAVFSGYIDVPTDDYYQFSINSDDGSRMYIGSTLIANNDGLHGMVEVTGSIGLKAGTHRFRIEFFNNGGPGGLIASVAGSAMAKQVIPASMFKHDLPAGTYRDPDKHGPTRAGLEAAYYITTLTTFSLPNFAALTPYLQTTVNDLNYPATTGAFANSGRSDNVGAVFTGYFTADHTDNYTFYLNSDEGSRLFIGGVKIIDNDGLHNMTEKSAAIGLKAGTHALRVEYFERTGQAGLVLSAKDSVNGKVVIPAGSFSRLKPCPADFDNSDFVDFDDFNQFVVAFEAGDPAADFDGSGFVDFDDFNLYVNSFEAGC